MDTTITREPGSRAPTEIDLYVGERVRTLRTELRLTLQDLAGRLGISHQQLQKYEVGTNRFSAGMLYNVAQALGISVSDLFPGSEPTRVAAGERAIHTLAEVRRVLKCGGV
jgi:transcriptional regulator with XRE-family HTH domain